MANPVVVVTGVGPGTGAAIARRFSRGGYAVAMLARSRDRLIALEREIESARAVHVTYACAARRRVPAGHGPSRETA